MTLTFDQLLQVVAAVALCGSAFYWGGSMKASVKKLCQVTTDHETRIRVLEHPLHTEE